MGGDTRLTSRGADGAFEIGLAGGEIDHGGDAAVGRERQERDRRAHAGGQHHADFLVAPGAFAQCMAQRKTGPHDFVIGKNAAIAIHQRGVPPPNSLRAFQQGVKQRAARRRQSNGCGWAGRRGWSSRDCPSPDTSTGYGAVRVEGRAPSEGKNMTHLLRRSAAASALTLDRRAGFRARRSPRSMAFPSKCLEGAQASLAAARGTGTSRFGAGERWAPRMAMARSDHGASADSP